MADLVIKRALLKYESNKIAYLESINDFFVLLVSYFLLSLSGILDDEKHKFFYGWFQITLMGVMTAININVVFISAGMSTGEAFKRRFKIFKRLKLQKARRKNS